MIEVIVEERCIGCMACVRVCPNDVFGIDETGSLPTLARTDDCCACYLCEAHCPVDALYVSPRGAHHDIDVAELIQSGVLGSYRRALGWDRRRPGSSARDAVAPPPPSPFGPPGGPAANHRTDSYAPGEVNAGHRHSPFDRIAAERFGAAQAAPDPIPADER
ncbi:MAG: ferredoxin family protein [Caulobacteraceae bacterium]